MGTHRHNQPPWARFLLWFRAWRYLAALKADEPKPISPKRLAQLKAQARAAARRVDE